MDIPLWSYFLFGYVVFSSLKDSAQVNKQRPTVILKNSIEFYNTTVKLEEKIDSLLQQLSESGDYSKYGESMQTPLMELQTSMSSIIEKLQKFKSQYTRDDFPLSEYKSFMEIIDAQHEETSLLADDIMPKFNEALVKVEEDKNGLFKEISAFISRKMVFEKDILQLEDLGVRLQNSESQKKDGEDMPTFDLSILTRLYEQCVKHEETLVKEKSEKGDSDDEIIYKLSDVSISDDQDENTVLSQANDKRIANFVPVVNEALERIEAKIESVGEKYDDLFNRWLSTAEDILASERKIMDLREELKLSNYVKEEL